MTNSAIANAAGDTWVDGALPRVEIGDSYTGLIENTNFPCEKETTRYLSYTNSSGQFSNQTRELSQENCFTYNDLGGFSSGYIKVGSYGYPVGNTSDPGTMVAVPQHSKIMWLRNPISGVGRTIRFATNIPAFGPMQAIYGNTNAFGLSITTPITMPALKDSVGNEIRVNAYNFSPNGRWMIAEAIDTGILRIDTETLQMQLISTDRVTYSQGFTPIATLAINDSGTTVLQSGRDFGPSKAYDLTGCQPGSFNVNSSNNLAATAGCRSRNIQAALDSAAGSTSTALFTMQFINDQYASALMRKASGSSVQLNRIKFMTAGYQPQTADYIALGDSFSSGEGANDNGYMAGTDVAGGNKCHLSPNSFPAILSRQSGLTNFHSVACSGAATDNYFVRAQYDSVDSQKDALWFPGIKTQQNYLKSSAPGVVTISMGGNDVGFAEKIAACAKAGTCDYASDPNRRTEVAMEISMMYFKLKYLYKDLVSTTSNKAKVYVIGYPNIAGNTSTCADNVHFDTQELTFIRQTTHYYNQVAKAAADAAGVYFINIENSLESQNLCSAATDKDMAVNGLTFGNDQSNIRWYAYSPAGYIAPSVLGIGNESYHPNEKGYQLMASAIASVTSGSLASFNICPGQPEGTNVCPKTSSVPQPDQTYFGSSAGNFVSWLNDGSTIRVDSQPAPQARKVVVEVPQNTHQAHIHVENLKPGGSVTISNHSTPTTLGTFTVAADGTLDATVTVPDTVEAGNHTLHLTGQNIAGESVDYYEPIFIAGPEGDIDGNGVPDAQQSCGFVPDSGHDIDHDGIDDACDGDLSQHDTAPPTVTATPTTRPNANGWYSQDVTLNWTSVDPDPSSGIPTQPTTTIVGQEGEHAYTSAQSCDPANNCATGTTTIKLDKTKPVITYTVSPAANSTGWHKDAATVTFSCADPLADQADPTSASGVDTCSSPITVNTDGSNQQVVGTAKDKAGNTQTVIVSLNLDTIPPSLGFTLSRTPNAQGWTNGPTTVTFDCVDATSGITTCSDPVTVTAEGGTIVTGTATDNAGNVSEVNVFVLIDSSLPAITAAPDRQPNNNNWFNTDVVVSFACNDALSGIVASATGCSAPAAITAEGVNQQITGTATDIAGNTSTTIYSANLDKTPPTLSPITASSTTKPTTGTATFTTTASDGLSGLSGGEYYLGDTDPGIGHGATLTKTGDSLSTTFGTDFSTGVYRVTFRAQDKAGNWSAPVSDYLVIYDPSSPKFTGKRTITPSLAGGDVLPGLIAIGQTDNAKFGFSVKYNSQGQISTNSDFQFTYNTGTKCNKPALAQNCHGLALNATNIQWMTTQGTNNSTGVFQGTGALVIDNQPTQTVLFRVTGRDGEQMSPTATDQFQVRIFQANQDPNTATPLYRVNMGDIGRGNIKVKN